VILLRGWFGVFSTGLDEIAEALKAKGIRAEVASHLSWKTAADEIVRERTESKTDALVLVGHSQGANNVIDMARVLEAHNVQVALLVTLAPYRQNPVPANVIRAINYYQSSGWGAPVMAEPGFHGKLSNIDVREDSTVSHINIDKSARIQAEIEREIGAVAKAN
jgi:thioesterase domain-containing protein